MSTLYEQCVVCNADAVKVMREVNYPQKTKFVVGFRQGHRSDGCNTYICDTCWTSDLSAKLPEAVTELSSASDHKRASRSLSPAPGRVRFSRSVSPVIVRGKQPDRSRSPSPVQSHWSDDGDYEISMDEKKHLKQLNPLGYDAKLDGAVALVYKPSLDMVLGFVQYTTDAKAQTVTIMNAVTAPGFRRQGVLTTLLEHLSEIPNTTKQIVCLKKSFDSARPVWTRLGFKMYSVDAECTYVSRQVQTHPESPSYEPTSPSYSSTSPSYNPTSPTSPVVDDAAKAELERAATPVLPEGPVSPVASAAASSR